MSEIDVAHRSGAEGPDNLVRANVLVLHYLRLGGRQQLSGFLNCLPTDETFRRVVSEEGFNFFAQFFIASANIVEKRGPFGGFSCESGDKDAVNFLPALRSGHGQRRIGYPSFRA